MDDEDAQARSGNTHPDVAEAGHGGRNPTGARAVPRRPRRHRGRTKAEVATQLMEQVVERGNMWGLCERVLRNKGAPGADGMRVTDLKAWLQAHWPAVKAARGGRTATGRRAVDIPKPTGGENTGRADGGRQADSTGGAASPATDFRGRVQRIEMASGRTQCVASGTSRQGPRQKRPGLGGGPRSCEILRPSQPRPAHGTRGKTSRRHPSARSHPPLPGSGTDARWGNAAKTGGYAAGRAAVAAAEQHLTDDLDRELERRGQSSQRYADDCNVYLETPARACRDHEGIWRANSSCRSTWTRVRSHAQVHATFSGWADRAGQGAT